MPAATYKGKLKVGEKTYEYVETKSGNQGAGPRGIDIWIVKEKGRKQYSIEPNPHDNPKYNKKQSSFYDAMAKALIDEHVANQEFPSTLMGVSWQGEDYMIR